MAAMAPKCPPRHSQEGASGARMVSSWGSQRSPRGWVRAGTAPGQQDRDGMDVFLHFFGVTLPKPTRETSFAGASNGFLSTGMIISPGYLSFFVWKMVFPLGNWPG